MVGDQIEVRGSVTPAGAERRVVVQIGDRESSPMRDRNGRFRDRAGGAAARESIASGSRAGSNRLATGSRDSAGRVTGLPTRGGVVVRPRPVRKRDGLRWHAVASTLGVAHKTLPCGTKVQLRYGGTHGDGPVVDRGPFAGNREYDLTAATKQALGFPDVGTVLTTR